MKITKHRLKQIITEELERFIASIDQNLLLENRSAEDKIKALLKQLEK